MKNFVKAIAVAVAGVLVLGAATAFANNGDDDGIVSIIDNDQVENGYENGYGYDYNYEDYYGQYLPMPTFHHRQGVVVSINDVYGSDDQMIRIEGEYGTTDLRVDFNTFVLGNPIEIGDEIKGFFPFGPAIMIYPPQFLAYAIINAEVENVRVDRFFVNEYTGTLISADGNLELNFTDDTAIQFQDGQDVRENIANINETYELDQELLEVLDGRMMVVVYGPTTRAIPAATIPGEDGQNVEIHVLWERAVHLGGGFGMDAEIGFGIDLPTNEDEVTIDWPINEVVINGELTELNWVRIRGAYFVPFRAVVDALGFGDTIRWVGETQTIYVSNGEYEIHFSIEANNFVANGETIELEHAAVLIGDSTYVPFRFFSVVFGMNNAFILEGQVVIDNEEAME